MSTDPLPGDAIEADVRALELSYWFGKLQYAAAEDLPRIRGEMRERIEELNNQGDAEAYERDANRQIPLPPEPPRDRVIEARDADGEVADQFTWSRRGWRGLGYAAVRPWYGVVWVAMQSGWSLWSVPAEGGDES